MAFHAALGAKTCTHVCYFTKASESQIHSAFEILQYQLINKARKSPFQEQKATASIQSISNQHLMQHLCKRSCRPGHLSLPKPLHEGYCKNHRFH
uniref:Uncharacterized protein n=1 Tax=Anguilla anguilla TaxID=7936 RepID=A0A0E9X3T8_ANGAN